MVMVERVVNVKELPESCEEYMPPIPPTARNVPLATTHFGTNDVYVARVLKGVDGVANGVEYR